MVKQYLAPLLLVLALFSTAGLAQSPTSASSTTRSDAFLPLSEVKPGMQGVARTVFSGTASEEYKIEIIGFVPGAVGPKQDMIIGKISGGSADRTAVFAGMSGSPVYINGKLVGAIAYSFPFSKEAICGITPIDQMVSIFKNGVPTESVPQPLTFSELVASTDAANSYEREYASSLGTFRPIATPVSFGGFSQRTIDQFAPELSRLGIKAVSAPGGSATLSEMKTADETTLVGGDSVTVHLARGDFNIAASGTVTLRDGEKIYAFGHPWLNLGASELPMSESRVVTVIPSVNNSFVVAVPTDLVGSVTQDRTTGVFGSLGRSAKMIPVEMSLKTSRGMTEKLNYEIAVDDILTPLLVNMSIYNAATAQERSIGATTIDLKATISVKNNKPIIIDRRFAGGQAPQTAAAAVLAPINALFRSRFADTVVESVKIDLTTVEGSKTAALDRITVDKHDVKPGETVNVKAFVRNNLGFVFTQEIPVKIPLGIRPGTLTLHLSEGAASQKRLSASNFVPANTAQLIDALNNMRVSDRLYLQMLRKENGVVVGSNDLPNLPPSALGMMTNSRSSGGITKTTQNLIGEIRIDPAEFVISGDMSLTINIIEP